LQVILAVRGARRAANGELPGYARPTDWKKSRRAGKERKRDAPRTSRWTGHCHLMLVPRRRVTASRASAGQLAVGRNRKTKR